jgi:hypothetical protein
MKTYGSFGETILPSTSEAISVTIPEILSRKPLYWFLGIGALAIIIFNVLGKTKNKHSSIAGNPMTYGEFFYIFHKNKKGLVDRIGPFYVQSEAKKEMANLKEDYPKDIFELHIMDPETFDLSTGKLKSKYSNTSSNPNIGSDKFYTLGEKPIAGRLSYNDYNNGQFIWSKDGKYIKVNVMINDETDEFILLPASKKAKILSREIGLRILRHDKDSKEFQKELSNAGLNDEVYFMVKGPSGNIFEESCLARHIRFEF